MQIKNLFLFFFPHNTCTLLPVTLSILLLFPLFATNLHSFSTLYFTPHSSLSPVMSRISLIHKNIIKPLNRWLLNRPV